MPLPTPTPPGRTPHPDESAAAAGSALPLDPIEPINTPRGRGFLTPTFLGESWTISPITLAISGYDDFELIGRGGMGTVFRARHIFLNRQVAIKIVTPTERTNAARELARFFGEAEAAAAVSHPNVVKVHEFGDANGQVFLTMEYLSAGSLAEKLANDGVFPPRSAAVIVAKLARGVHAAHEQGIVHRDLKPGNIIFDDKGEPKITDFGLAKRGLGSDLTRTQAVMGTPGYMSPEQARGDAKFVGPSADIYALGVILYECLINHRPFDAIDPVLLLRQVVEDTPPPLGRWGHKVPKDLEQICLKCLAKSPTERYHTAADLADDLDRFLDGKPVYARAPGLLERWFGWAKRKPTVALAWIFGLMTLCLSTVAAVVIHFWQAAETARKQSDTTSSRLLQLLDNNKALQETLALTNYNTTIDLAHRDFQNNSISLSRKRVDDCQWDLRDWEWNYLHRLNHAERLTFTGHTGRILGLAVFPDGERAVSVGEFGAIQVWNLKTGAVLFSRQQPDAIIQAVAVSPNHSIFATGQSDGLIQIWDADNFTRIREMKGPHLGVTGLAFSPINSHLAVGTNHDVSIYDSTSGQLIRTFGEMPGGACHVTISRDGSRVAATNRSDGTVHIWNANNGEKIDTVRTNQKVPSPIAFLDDPNLIVVATGSYQAMIWDIQGKTKRVTLNGHTAPLTTFSLSPDGKRLVSGSEDRMLRIWEIPAKSAETHANVESLFSIRGHTNFVNTAVFTTDGNSVISSSEDRTIRVWDAQTNPERLRLQHNAPVRGVTFTPDNSKFLTGSEDGCLRIWSTETWKCEAELTSDAGHIYSVVAFPDNSRAATIHQNGTITVWDLFRRQTIKKWQSHSLGVTTLALSPDGRTLISGGKKLAPGNPDKQNAVSVVRVWDPDDGRQLLEINELDGTLQSLAVAPDGKRLLTVMLEGSFAVWSLETEQRLQSYSSGDMNCEAATFLPSDDPRIDEVVITYTDGTAMIWNLKTGTIEHTLIGHVGPIKAVVANREGTRIITCGSDRLLKLWDRRTGQALLSLDGHYGWLVAAASSPNGRWIASGGGDRVAIVWDAGTGKPVKRITR